MRNVEAERMEQRAYGEEIEGFRCRVSAQPLAAKGGGSLIEMETLAYNFSYGENGATLLTILTILTNKTFLTIITI